MNPKTIKKFKDLSTGKYYSEADLQAWTTGITKIKIDKGKRSERKAQKRLTQGKKYNNKQAQQRHSYNENAKALKTFSS